MKASLKSLKSVTPMKSLKSLTSPKMLNNSTSTNIVLFLYIALSVGYLVNKHYEALIFMYVLSGVLYLFCKNKLCSLGISLLLTNLLLSMNYFKVTEGSRNINNDEPQVLNNSTTRQLRARTNGQSTRDDSRNASTSFRSTEDDSTNATTSERKFRK